MKRLFLFLFALFAGLFAALYWLYCKAMGGVYWTIRDDRTR